MTYDRFRPPTASDNMASCVCCGERIHYENINSVGECPLCNEYFEEDDMSETEIGAMKVLTASAVSVAERLKKEVADLKKERDMWIFNAQELQKGFNKLDKEQKHWLGELEQIQELKARAERLKQQNYDLFNRIDALLRAGQMCSNCCFNIAQQERLKDGNAKPLIESYKAWDEAATATRKAMRSE